MCGQCRNTYKLYGYLNKFGRMDVSSIDVDLSGYCSFLIMIEVVV